MVTKTIFDLLYEHNCVILPGFGGFIANRLPSRVNDLQQRVEPSRKIVAFNKNLVQNDGLLADHIAQKESISFDEANEKIDQYVNQLRTEISLKRHSSIKGIGDFYLNTENNIVFIPEADINFAKDTFGLYPVPVRRISRSETETQPASPRLQPLPSAKPSRVLNRRLVYGAMLITLPLVLGYFTQRSGLLQKADFNISRLFKPAGIAKPEETAPAIIKPNEPVAEEKITQETLPATGALPEKENKTIPVAPGEEYSNKDVPNETSKTYHYHIIGGSFAYPENAYRFLQLLKSKGYKAYIAGTNANGLMMVSFAGFETAEAALIQLPTLQQNENAQAWLLNK